MLAMSLARRHAALLLGALLCCGLAPTSAQALAAPDEIAALYAQSVDRRLALPDEEARRTRPGRRSAPSPESLQASKVSAFT